MLKDIPYDVIKQDKRAYEIMLIRDQHGSSFAKIAKEFDISASRVIHLYYKVKLKQIHLYINHIAAVAEGEDFSQMKNLYHSAYECYQDWTYACAYLEKKYQDILTAYRDGEPGMPAQFIKNLPPYKSKLSKKTVDRIIELRDKEKASFAAIAKELHLTQAKARHTYEMFYHKKVLALINELQKKAKNEKEKEAIWDYYFKICYSSKKRYDMLTQK